MIRKQLGLLLTALMTLSAGAYPKLEISLSVEGEPCPSRPGYPESRCLGIKNCSNVELYIKSGNMTLYDVVGCGIGVYMELVCCPNKPPNLQTVSSTTDSSPAGVGPMVPESEPKQKRKPEREPYRHVVSLQYLNALTFDSYVMRCTGVLLKENFALTSAACAGSFIADPNHVRLGLSEPFKDLLEIDNITYHNNDLVLLHMSHGYSREFIAEVCKQVDVENRLKLIAVGFSQKNEENCSWFEREVTNVTFDSCDRVSINRPVRGIDNINHICVSPKTASPRSPPGSCVECLRGSASILYVIRPDGSDCVAGIATPTSKSCIITTHPLYYTSLFSPINSRFLNDELSGSGSRT
ncbi:uncharacterized protein [Drosophila pseudoobscura]|uniref:Uncharacterized protein isoform X1 n=1 Tax=Drosophila pseudoobscura pseudoobscura TaxID=46245 RepID=A0A0R3P7G6_DROPS|nr:uncharacterized protein LOC6901024 isoform X1 [Drosophila pseudoobscura]